MDTYSVYITQNLLSPEKAYVGMTNGHQKNYMGSDKDLKKDIKNIGIENFNKTILGTFDNWQECHYWEGFYVKTLKTHIEYGGYNKRDDGGAYILMTPELKNKLSKTRKENNLAKGENNGMFGKKHSKESNEKNRQAHLGKTHTEESKRKISKNNAKNKPFLGKHHSEETKRKMSINSSSHKPEVRKRISKSLKNIKHAIITCPYCDVSGGSHTMKRWHFNNCKLK